MNIMKLKKERALLMQRFNNGLKRVSGLLHIDDINDNLYEPLKEEERKQFEAADGDELKWKASRANSSACLLLNTFSSLRQGNPLEISKLGAFTSYELEKKLPVLNGRGKKANIDMVLSNDDTIIYIESKFTELFYYNHKKTLLSDAYFNVNKYPSKDIYQAAKQLFNQFNHFDGNQLIKHTIGIYRDCLENPERYQDKKVILMNLCWELHDTNYKYEDSFQLQLRAIKEASMFSQSFNQLMKKVFDKIGIKFDFIYLNYYDFIHHQTNIVSLDQGLVEYLNKRYFFYHLRKVGIEDRIDYIKAHIIDDLSLEDFENYLTGFKIISIQYLNQMNQIIYDLNYAKLSDAIILIGPKINEFPKDYDVSGVNEFMHITSPLYFNQYTMIYLNKGFPRIKHYLIK